MTALHPHSSRGRIASAAAVATVVVLAVGCGSAGTRNAGPGHRAPPASLPLATSIGGPGQPAWAVVQMGGSSASHNNFWELFVRPDGSAQWKLATPLGVASNGGLTVTSAGAGAVAGFHPSQDLTFSPLAATASPAAAWSQGGAPVTPGLASVPDALAAGPSGQLLALTRTGEVLFSAHDGAAWTRLTSLRTVAASAAGRQCGLTELTAVAFTSAGTPLLGGACTRIGAAGVFIAERGATVAAAVPLQASGAVTVLGLTRQANRTMALLEVGTGAAAGVVAAWLATGPSGGTVSAAVPTLGGAPRSEAMWSGGGAGLVLTGGRAETIARPGANWQALPTLPARTATLALGPDGLPEALAARGASLTVWQLTADGTGWNQVQQIKVTIPYGSSG